mmetsp:Transcript_44233/g.134012  ORF Transcript_44233/g.134012 Transcript_44233/m.134012 type:complete len:91 (-) Transcript_44233:218-490(-)
MISEAAATQFPGPLYCDKEGNMQGPYGADKGVTMPAVDDPMVALHAASFKASPGSVQSLMQGRKDPCKLAVSNFQAAAAKKVKGAIASGK